MKKLKALNYGVDAFADDCELVCEQGKAMDAIADARLEFGKIGLTLNEDKCEILSRDGKVEFLSQDFVTPSAEPISFSHDL